MCLLLHCETSEKKGRKKIPTWNSSWQSLWMILSSGKRNSCWVLKMYLIGALSTTRQVLSSCIIFKRRQTSLSLTPLKDWAALAKSMQMDQKHHEPQALTVHRFHFELCGKCMYGCVLQRVCTSKNEVMLNERCLTQMFGSLLSPDEFSWERCPPGTALVEQLRLHIFLFSKPCRRCCNCLVMTECA